MTAILRIRARRFHALHALLTGDAGSVPLAPGNISDHRLRDIGLPEGPRGERPASHLGVTLFAPRY